MFYYLIGFLSAIALLIGTIFCAKAKKIESQKIEQIIEKKKNEIEDATEHEAALFDKMVKAREQIENECKQLERIRLSEQARAQEARDATERLLQAEQERARASLDGVKRLEEQKMKHEFEAKEQYYANQLEFKKQQFTEDFDILNDYFQEELSAAKAELVEFQLKRAAINEAIRREKEIQEKESFYSIDVPKNDQEDIELLQSMDVRLHNRDVVPKLIWELFIRRPCQEMIKRVTGGRKVGGIYKITYKKTGEAYIGKTTDFATRWQNHCKTAIGLEGAARATLHNRLAKDGIWNYTWEILEEVAKDNLSSRESYYIDLYGTKNQLNMKSGEK